MTGPTPTGAGGAAELRVHQHLLAVVRAREAAIRERRRVPRRVAQSRTGPAAQMLDDSCCAGTGGVAATRSFGVTADGTGGRCDLSRNETL
jgi:hypothetical protein